MGERNRAVLRLFPIMPRERQGVALVLVLFRRTFPTEADEAGASLVAAGDQLRSICGQPGQEASLCGAVRVEAGKLTFCKKKTHSSW